MAESSVDSYINAQPEQAMSWDEFYNDWFRRNVDPNFTGERVADHWSAHLENFFTGHRDKAYNEYQAYLNNLNNRNEALAVQSARAWDKMMDDTRVQRMMADYEKAGLNPFLLLNNGGVSAGSVPTSSKASYGSKSTMKEKVNDQKGRNLALVLLAVAKIAATLL